jgi:chalcone isomerase-like protein
VKWRTALGTVVLALLSLMQAAAIQVPSGLRVGNQMLPARSCATRDTLWIHHYAAALYLSPKESPVAALQDPRQPKALHVQILSRTFLPRDLPIKWRETLESHLDLPSFTSVRLAWRELAVGDRVTIAYAPDHGVTLQLNDRVIARSPRHDVIDALLQTWTENEPLPQRVSRVIAKNPCRT